MKKNGLASLFFLIPLGLLCNGDITGGFFTTATAAEAEAEAETGGAGVDLGFSGELIKTTCDVRLASNLLHIEPIGVNDLSGLGSVSSFSKPFTLTIENCLASSITLSKINLNFKPLVAGGSVAPGAFSNQAKDAAENIIDNGVGFAVYDQRDDQNVLTTVGESRQLVYPVTANAPLLLPREFYVKYMQISPAITAGAVDVTLIVSAYYE